MASNPEEIELPQKGVNLVWDFTCKVNTDFLTHTHQNISTLDIQLKQVGNQIIINSQESMGLKVEIFDVIGRRFFATNKTILVGENIIDINGLERVELKIITLTDIRTKRIKSFKII